ncbi:hypothetical protein [Elizabethkingia meningoseptica]|uniref:hypothetical protein n=1 Tax=Elizabethkingia meningoseptica TaxID=238 RepID=UPI0023B031AA|nr:hypothetical protein [Elizabethkingia meningoseptica]MDE5492431.1 hypothetical protein [Elizabethkingia meningoseptica]
MKRQFCIVFTCFLTITGWGQTEKNINLTAPQWRDDLHVLYDSLRANHLNMFHHTPKEVFDHKYQSIYKEIPALNHDQIILRFKQFVSLVGDGHTTLFIGIFISFWDSFV